MEHHATHGSPYLRLYLMAALSFVAMFVLMYAMVDRIENVFLNLNQVYMAALMVAPMVLIELAVMRAMYPSKRHNAAIAAASVILLGASWLSIRQQGAIGNEQFLRSMIPHHASAVLMCEQLRADDPEIKQLCAEILRSQKAEIKQMNALLEKPQ
jgi:hypothetical protein